MLKFNLKTSISILLIFFAQAVFANAAPFGVTIGKSTFKEVKNTINSKAKLLSTSYNDITGGKNYTYSGHGLGVPGLKTASFIFYKDNVLAGVILSLPKSNYPEIKANLKSKYDLTGEDAPFVGNKMVSFRAGDVDIKAYAPHMNFQMEVHYIQDKFLRMYNEIIEKDTEQSKKMASSSL